MPRSTTPPDSGTGRDATIILICGLPGSGKATLAKQLERDRDALRLSEDDWMVQLFASTDGRGEPEREAIKNAQWQIALRVAQLGIDVVLDWGFWSRRERDIYRDRAAAARVRTELRFLDVSLAELTRRLAARNLDPQPATFPVEERELKEWWESFERPTAEELG
jgi:predicted kinase